jgi:hypothetical protein
MALVTHTSTVFDRQPVANATGDITVSGQFNSGAVEVSVSDVVLLAKIPHGATVTEICVDHSNGETALGVDYGLATGGAAGGTSSISAFISALAISTVGRMAARRAAGANPGGVQVSVSDSSPARYGIFAAFPISGTGTDSTIINFSITYRCDATQV